ncbi:MAG: BON domain-containing protein [Ginsengibacter sp.]
MADYNRNNDYRDDNRSYRNRDYDMNWDRNYRTGDEYRGYDNGNRNVYSSDRERDYWNGRRNEGGYDTSYNSKRDYNNYNDLNRDSYASRYNSNYRNERYNDYNRNYTNDSNRNDNYGSYRDYDRMNDNYMGRNNDYYSRLGNNYDRYNSYDNRYDNWRRNDRFNSYDNRNNDWRNNDRNDRDWWDKTKDEVASWFGDDDAERRRRRDEMRNGQHRGKGPKNYTRSEERIREDVSDQLTDDSWLDASGIEVSVKNGDVTLSGEVDSKYAKHRAEDLAEDVTGVKNVQNNLRVREDVDNTINKSSMNNGDRNITSNTSYNTTKNKKETTHA